MKFDIYNAHAKKDSVKAKLCVNMDRIETITHSYKIINDPEEHIANHPPDRDPWAQPNMRVPRRQIMIVEKDRFNIILRGGGSYTVSGDFDEISDMLCNFRNKMESV